MGDYERNQLRLQALMNEVLSDEEPFGYSSESYKPSTSNSESSHSSDSPIQKKKRSQEP